MDDIDVLLGNVNAETVIPTADHGDASASTACTATITVGSTRRFGTSRGGRLTPRILTLMRKESERCDIHIKPEAAIRLHSSTESPKHLIIKSLLARELKRIDRPFYTEVRISNAGRVDELDLGGPAESPTVYEFECDATPKQAKAKVDQYCVGPIRDMVVLDPQAAPEKVDEIVEWLRTEVAGMG